MVLPAAGLFTPGLVVWAKYSTWPWWPGVIVDREVTEPYLRDPENLAPATRTNRMVDFFCSSKGSIAVVHVRQLKEYTGNMILSKQAKGRQRKIQRANEEAIEWLDANGWEFQMRQRNDIEKEAISRLGVHNFYCTSRDQIEDYPGNALMRLGVAHGDMKRPVSSKKKYKAAVKKTPKKIAVRNKVSDRMTPGKRGTVRKTQSSPRTGKFNLATLTSEFTAVELSANELFARAQRVFEAKDALGAALDEIKKFVNAI